MTVSNAYLRFLTDLESHKTLVYYFPDINASAQDIEIIVQHASAERDMAIGGKLKRDSKEPVAVAVEEENGLEQTGAAMSNLGQKLRNIRQFNKSKSGGIFLKVIYVTLDIIALILAFALVSLTVITSVETKAYDTETNSRLVAMVLLAVTAGITVVIIVYGIVAVFKKQPKALHTTVVVFLVLVIIQALIAGIAVKVSPKDEDRLGKSLVSSFAQARQEIPKHLKLWAMTQYGLGCCGVVGPEDYRDLTIPVFFPPNVPISCCPNYDPERSDLVQEKERETCKAKRSYYLIGCNALVLSVFKETASMVISVTVALIFTEIFLMIFGGILSRRAKAESPESDK